MDFVPKGQVHDVFDEGFVHLEVDLHEAADGDPLVDGLRQRKAGSRGGLVVKGDHKCMGLEHISEHLFVCRSDGFSGFASKKDRREIVQIWGAEFQVGAIEERIGHVLLLLEKKGEGFEERRREDCTVFRFFLIEELDLSKVGDFEANAIAVSTFGSLGVKMKVTLGLEVVPFKE